MLPAPTKLPGIMGAILDPLHCYPRQCPVETVIVKGRVAGKASANSKVRVRLVYPKEKPGESGEVTVEDGAFRIPIEFVTMQSSIFTNLPKRCGRKPKTVVITLLENDQQSDEVFGFCQGIQDGRCECVLFALRSRADQYTLTRGTAIFPKRTMVLGQRGWESAADQQNEQQL